MPSALELYYQQKAKKNDVPEDVKSKAISELLGSSEDILKKKSPGLFVRLLDLLDRPGNAARALLVGKLGGLKGLIPFASVLEDLTGLDIALNKEDRVPGTEVIETWFGKQQQRKGKLDPVDALGLLVEVVADPLWLVGGPGLTKAGQAAKIVKGALKGSRTFDVALKAEGKIATEMPKLRAAIAAARAGEPMPAGIAKYLANAIRTVFEGGKAPQGIFRAKSWAEQVTAGERALLKLGLPGSRKTVIRGAKVWEGAEKLGTKIKKGFIGQKFLSVGHKLPPIYEEKFHNIATHLTRDLPEYETSKWADKLRTLYEQAKSAGIDPADLTDYIEAKYSGRPIVRAIQDITTERGIKFQRVSKKLQGRLRGLGKRQTAAQERLRKGSITKIPEEPELFNVPRAGTIGITPEIKGFSKPSSKGKIPKTKQVVHPADEATRDWLYITGQDERLLRTRAAHRTAQAYEGKISKLKGRINRLEAKGTKKSAAEINKLNEKIQRMQAKAYVDTIKGANREMLRKYAAAKSKLSYAADIRVTKAKTEIAGIQREIQKTLNRIERAGKLSKRDAEKIAALQKRTGELKVRAGELETKYPTIKGVAEPIQERYAKMPKEAKELGIPLTEITGETGYAPHVITEKGRKFVKRPGIFGRSKEFSVREGSQLRRKGYLQGKTRLEAEEIMKGLGFEGKEFFEPSAFTGSFKRVQSAERVIGSAKAIRESIRRFSKKVPEGADWIPVNDFLEKTGLKIPKGSYAGRFLPAEVANALTELRDIVRKDEFATFFSNVNRFFKGALTVYFPAYHGRNAISNLALNWIAGVKNPKSYITAARLQNAARATRSIMKRTGQTWDEVARTVDWPTIKTALGTEIPGWQIYDLADKYGIVGRSLGMMGTSELAGDIFGKRKGFIGRTISHQGRAGKIGRDVGMGVENNARLAHFIDKYTKGLSAEQAAASVKRVLFDYGDLSEFERKVLRDRLFLFYTFARKNIALQTKTLLQQPGKQAFYAHLAGGTPRAEENRMLPSWQQETLNVPLPVTSKEGKRYMIRSTGLPIEEAFGPWAGPGVGVGNRLQRILSRQMSRLAPLPYKIPIEVGTGQELYFQQPIRKWGRYAQSVSPWSRFATVYRQAKNVKEPLASRISGLTTGIRFRPADEVDRQYLIRQIIRELLAQQPETREFRRFYVPAAKKSEASQQTQRLLRLQK